MIEIDKDQIKHHLNGHLKKQVEEFVGKLNLDKNVERKIKNELGSNWADGLFDVDVLIEKSVEFIVSSIKDNKLTHETLWHEVVINASKHSEIPAMIADDVIRQRQNNFESDEYGSRWVFKQKVKK